MLILTMGVSSMDLTDEQWAIIEPLIPEGENRASAGQRPERKRGLDLQECFSDGTFVVAKKGALGWERPSGARVRSSWQWQYEMASNRSMSLLSVLSWRETDPKTMIFSGSVACTVWWQT